MIFPYKKNIIVSGSRRAWQEPLLPEEVLQDDGNLSQGVVRLVRGYVERYLKNYEGTDRDSKEYGDWPGWDCMWAAVLYRACDDLAKQDSWTGNVPPVEKTVAELLRSGVPQSDISVNHKNVTLRLKNGKYRLFRKESPVVTCAMRVMEPGVCPVIPMKLSPVLLAKLLLALDAAMPEIRKAMDGLLEGVKAADMERKARRKAEEIEKVTVRRLLETTLDPMDIVARFGIEGEVVHLTLTRTLKAELNIPMERLREFLSDPGRIESVLVPQKDAEKFGNLEIFT